MFSEYNRYTTALTPNPCVCWPCPSRNGDWCSGRFYHLKEVCWSDPTEMFVRYRGLTRGADSTVQEPRVLAPFYSKLDDMADLFKRVWNHSNSWFNPGIIGMSYLLIYIRHFNQRTVYVPFSFSDYRFCII